MFFPESWFIVGAWGFCLFWTYTFFNIIIAHWIASFWTVWKKTFSTNAVLFFLYNHSFQVIKGQASAMMDISQANIPLNNLFVGASHTYRFKTIYWTSRHVLRTTDKRFKKQNMMCVSSVVQINGPGMSLPYEKHRDLPTVNPRCAKSPSSTTALFLTVSWHHQHGPTAAALLQKLTAETVSYFHRSPREEPTAFVFPVTCFQLSHH